MSTTVLSHGRVTWTNIILPTEEDIDQLRATYPQIHPLNLRDCLNDLEFPKIDQYDDYLFLVIQLPVWDPQKKISHPAEVDILISSGVLITSHTGELQTLNNLFAQAQADEETREKLMDSGASPLLYEILHELIDYCYPMMNKVNQNIRHIEDHLFHAETEHILQDIAIVRRDVIAMRHIIRPQYDVILTLENGNWPFIHNDLTLYWSNLGDHLAQLRAMLDEFMDVVNGLSDTIDTLASHRIDGVVRVLTLITILTAPLTLLATVFGINVDLLPHQFHPILFFSVNILGIGLTLVLLRYLKRKRWV